MIYKNILILFIFIFSLFSLSNISLGDFLVTTPYSEINVCECNLFSSSYTVKNIGNEIKTYNIYQEGVDFSTVFPNSFILMPQESININHIINAPCNEKKNYQIKTEIQESQGIKKEIKQNINVQKCIPYSLKGQIHKISLCPGDVEILTITLKNLLDISDYYELYYNSKNIYVTFSESSFFLMPKEEKKIYAYFMAPLRSIGKETVDIYAKNENTNIEVILSLEPEIIRCSSYNLSFGNSTYYQATKDTKYTFEPKYTICSGMDTNIPLRINHAGKTSTYYDIISKNDIAFIENSTLFLAPNSTGITYLTLKPYHYDYEQKIIEIEVHSEGVIDYYNIPIELAWCHTLIIEDIKTKLSYEETYIPFNVINKGVKETYFEIFHNGPEWIGIYEKHYDENGYEYYTKLNNTIIQVNEEETFYIKANTNKDSKGKHNFNIYFNTEFQKRAYSNNVVLNVGFSFETILLFLQKYLLYILIFILILILLLILYIIIKKILLKKEKNKEEKYEELKSEEKKEIIDKDKEKIEDDSELVVLNIKEPKKEIKKEKKIKTSYYKEEEKVEKKIRLWPIILIVLLLLLLLVGGIFLWNYFDNQKDSKIEKEQDSTQEIINETYTPENEENNITSDNLTTNYTLDKEEKQDIKEMIKILDDSSCHFRIYPDEEKIIDLTDYFYDPDGDKLNFQIVNHPSFVKAQINDEIIKITIEESYYGFDTIELSASDDQGGHINTGNLTICAYPEEHENNFFKIIKKSFLFLFEYRFYILLGFVLLIIIIILIRHFEKKDIDNNNDINNNDDNKPLNKEEEKKETKKTKKKSK
jgi:flagellar basal body-associated protein FliL